MSDREPWAPVPCTPETPIASYDSLCALFARCATCGRYYKSTFLALTVQHGALATVGDITRRLKCSKCETRGVTISAYRWNVEHGPMPQRL